MKESDFYIQYDVDTLNIYSISGSRHVSIPTGKNEAPIKESIALEFIVGSLVFHNYFVHINEDGYAEVIPKGSTSVDKHSRLLDGTDNIVRDLSYRSSFFDKFMIEFTYSDKLLLTFNFDKLSTQSKYYFNTTVIPNVSECTVYVTKYKDPSALLKKYKIDIYKLKESKTLELDLDVTDKISVWASKL